MRTAVRRKELTPLSIALHVSNNTLFELEVVLFSVLPIEDTVGFSLQRNTSKTLGTSRTAVTIRKIFATVVAVKTHFEVVHVISTTHRMVAEFSGITPKIKIETVFTVAQTGTIDAALTVLSNVTVVAMLGKETVISVTIFASHNKGILMWIGHAHLFQFFIALLNQLMMKRLILLYLLLVLFFGILFIEDAILLANKANAEEAIFAPTAVIEKLTIATVCAVHTKIKIIAGTTTDNLVATCAFVRNTCIHGCLRTFCINAVEAILTIACCKYHVAIFTVIGAVNIR